MSDLEIKSPSFEDNGYMPKRHTGFDEDISPEFQFLNLSADTISISIIMDDLDIPLIKEYNHWIIWNIPKTERITEKIPYGSTVPSLHNAIQGVGYGVNRYRGPKQPFFVRNSHRYIFTFYALDCFLNLASNSKKKDLLEAMRGHIIQLGTIIGKYKR
jgi:Raf kinase inhibitor-like protein, YbhB/YbcL family